MLRPDQQLRYARHLTLRDFGLESQSRLLASSVLLVGAGGLGSPAAIYLAAAGVGRIGIVDDDVVDISNLQRQILHRTCDAGTPKTESAQRAINDCNPDVKVEPINERFGPDNARDLIRNYDLILDGADNFPTRYLINDAAVLEQRPIVHGSIFNYEGQVSVFNPPAGRGDFNFWIAIGIYFFSTLAYVAMCVWLVPSFPWVFFLAYGFIYTPVISYITARMEGIAGQFVSLPLVREASFIAGARFFGYQGIEIWYAPIPIHNYGAGCLNLRKLISY